MSSTNNDFEDPFTNISIPRYFEGKSIFITGGTGFIGKIVVEKLLRECPRLKNIYFLIRPKKGLTCEERLEKMFNVPLFEQLKGINADSVKKIIPVPGDIVHQGLGISSKDVEKIAENVNIVIHSAATVKFEEPIRVAMEKNVMAVNELLKIVKRIKNLDVFCHVSTAYSQCNLSDDVPIEERFYTPAVHYKKILACLEWMSDDIMEGFTKPLLGKYPNTYTFTKALAEQLLHEEASDLPLVIVRPSVVSAVMKDPVPGWVDNYNNIAGFVVAAGKGMLRTAFGPERKVKNDIVPVDFVSNCIISSIWYTGIKRPSAPIICNCTSGNFNPTSFLYLSTIVVPLLHEYPYNSIFRRPNFAFEANQFLVKYWQVISHWIPAIIADGLSLMVGSKPKFMNMYRLIDNNVSTLQPFICQEWTWENKNFSKILNALSNEDRENFDFDMRKIDWKEYYKRLTIGIKVYLLRDDMAQLPKAIQLQKRYRLVRWISTMFITLLACRFFFVKSEKFRTLWFEALFAIYRFLQYFKVTSLTI